MIKLKILAAIFFVALLFSLSSNSQKKTTQITKSYPTPTPIPTIVSEKLIASESTTKSNWLQVSGMDYSISFPKDWSYQASQSKESYFGQGISLTSPDSKVRISISADVNFDFTKQPQIKEIPVYINSQRYLGKEMSTGEYTHLFIEMNDLLYQGQHYSILYATTTLDYSAYSQYKPTALQILSTIKYADSENNISSWKTHRSSKDNFSFRYPPFFRVEEIKNNSVFEPSIIIYDTRVTMPLPDSQKMVNPNNIYIYTNQTFNCPKETCQQRKPVIIGENEYIPYEEGLGGHNYFLKGLIVFSVFNEIDEKDLIFSQILSTLKFTNDPTNLSLWKTYTNKTYNYTLKYPGNLKKNIINNDSGKSDVGLVDSVVTERGDSLVTQQLEIIVDSHGSNCQNELSKHVNSQTKQSQSFSKFRKRSIDIGSIDAVSVESIGEYSVGKLFNQSIYFCDSKGDLFSIYWQDSNLGSDRNLVIDQILSTFKFISP